MCLAIFALYATYINELSPTKAYVVLSYFNLVIIPLRMLLISYINLYSSKVSLQRLGHFMKAEEIDSSFVIRDSNDPIGTIKVENCDFSWETVTAA